MKMGTGAGKGDLRDQERRKQLRETLGKQRSQVKSMREGKRGSHKKKGEEHTNRRKAVVFTGLKSI